MRQTGLIALAAGCATIVVAMSISHHVVHAKTTLRPIRPISTLMCWQGPRRLGLPRFHHLLSAAGM
jgi:hypothetical protein